jgi:hypothetical protein
MEIDKSTASAGLSLIYKIPYSTAQKTAELHDFDRVRLFWLLLHSEESQN